ncbi:hypothetical protein ACIQC8_11150 [Agrococcus sediminis]|jgi:hypothetical protein|uniref:hypothetical protein n=1 Tax=Agrococcus TaxID=46352 RepID=UPI000FE2F7BB|nr:MULTISPECIES: hypothetical protein [unclassified Agrococcus]MDR7232880.1 outer membrane receptor protein involved in Fe transport [Agrococcus sp. BE272]RWR24151.1 hypothetical protein D8Y24_06220 [Agrococcus lahaulensis]UOW00130.1 hypothetical protein MU522_09270 [Agrococcus sp. SCSIO52902]
MTAITTTTPGARVRLTARGRRALALLVAAPVLAAGALAGAGVLGDALAGAVASSTAETAQFEHITVMPGQSLWQIAEAVAPEADPRDVVAEIELLNGIAGAIQPGERLAIPAHYSG